MPSPVRSPGSKAERFSEYLPITKEVIKRHCHPDNQIVSSTYVMFHVKEDPNVFQKYAPHNHSKQALQSVISSNLRQIGGVKQNTKNRKSAPYNLPIRVREL